MALTTGTRLGVYEILAPLGAGGMGEVYRARDTKLGRSVAIKVLPDALASDPDRIARLEREAKVLASLTHHNIAALYGMEVTDSGHFLVMELVEGETLADRLTRGPLKTAAALDLARQIAEALEAAHEQGVVHRDLKPANVKITPDETVKVLDFGLAKAMEQGSGVRGDAAEQRANSPTLSMMATQAGMVLGTAAYMSPEQAKGANADQRSDVFSFGVVLYEMLTGRQPFQGETAPEVMASVLIRDPDLTALPANLHPRLRDVITRCLEKQPKKRWQAIGDLRVELEAIAAAPHDTTGSRALPAVPRPLWKRALAVVVTVALTTGITGGVMWRVLRPANPSVVRFPVVLTEGQRFVTLTRQFLAVSRDGKRIAFLVGGESGRGVLMERALDELEARPIGGLNLAVTSSPFFSPDGRWIGFWSGEDSTLKKVAVTGGAAVTLGKADNPAGVHWDGDWVVFAQPGTGIMRVAAAGGQPELVARVHPPESASSPQLINGGRTLLFAVASGSSEDRWDKANIVVQPIGSDERQVIVRGGSAPSYLSTGHLLYVVGGTVFAVAFDPRSARVSGGPVPVVEGVLRSSPGAGGSAQVAVSDTGTLAYAPGSANPSGQRTLALMDRDGRAQPLSMPPNSYQTPRVSPDGRQVVVATDDGTGAIVWIHGLSGTGPPRRLTFGGRNRYPVWTRDGGSIIFQSDRDGDLGLFQQRADGSGQAERLTTAEKGAEHMAGSLTPDGKTLVFTVTAPSTATAIWTVSTTGDRTPRPLLAIPEKALVSPAISPDGRWLAYGSNELGPSGYYVFVQPFPQTGAQYQVTTALSSTPVWSAGGKQILSSYADQISASDVQTTPQFMFGAATRIRSEGSYGSLPAIRNFDVMPDGRLLLILPGATTTTGPRTTTQRINVVLNWFEELRAKVK